MAEKLERPYLVVQAERRGTYVHDYPTLRRAMEAVIAEVRTLMSWDEPDRDEADARDRLVFMASRESKDWHTICDTGHKLHVRYEAAVRWAGENVYDVCIARIVDKADVELEE